MNATVMQGRIFCALAALTAGAVLGARWVQALGGSEAFAPWLLAVVVLLGMPHGALDTLYVSRQFGLRSPGHWMLFGLAYLAPVAGVLLLWSLSPSGCLIGFFILSAFHFAGDPAETAPGWSRALYGGAPIVLPALWHETELVRLFSFLTDAGSASLIGAYLHGLSFLWLTALLAAAVLLATAVLGVRNWHTAMEFGALGVLSTVAPPLWSFAVYFCAMHSARHILRTLQARESSWQSAGLAMAVPLLVTFGALGAGLMAFQSLTWEAKGMRLVFIGLAALTLPHALLVDGPRFGWAIRGLAAPGLAVLGSRERV